MNPLGTQVLWKEVDPEAETSILTLLQSRTPGASFRAGEVMS